MARTSKTTSKKKPSATIRRRGKLDASSWISAGLDLLARGGVDAVRIDEMTRTLGVTKGSFYWHFRDRAQLLEAMLETWRRDATLAVIERIETQGSAAERLKGLIELPTISSHRGQSLELAVRLWARRDPQAQSTIDEIDHQRLTYVASLLRANGVAEAKVEASAYLICAFVLAEHLISAKSARRSVSPEALRTLVGEFVRVRQADKR